ncbi:uncharacterized protein LOC132551321 [Ylistrum balloti]|uniref:uncharacterized protein LOC132551321 n=1 Tax=Ylistrum balloti TaxID=509963 RepID=UPI002905F175|nr:uncharacterized protein LOC132551321 [Ylistrum balloti]
MLARYYITRVHDRQATGGGPALYEDDAKPWEKLIIGTFTRSAVEGVSGGVDTSQSSLSVLEKEGSSMLEASGATSQTSFIPDNTSTSSNMHVTTCTAEEASISVEDASTKTKPILQFKKNRKISLYNSESTGNLQEDFYLLEKEKFKYLKEYKEKKIKLQEKLLEQQEEMLQLQRKSTTALELLDVKIQPGQSFDFQSSMSPFSVSPVIGLGK